MQAVILIGGEGTRLRPLSCHTPKAMVPILNRPLLEHLLRYLEKHGIRDIILAAGNTPSPIQNWLDNSTPPGVRVTCQAEESPMGTAGAVKHAESLLDEPFIVLNGDILTEIDLSAMLRQHQKIKPQASIALTPVDNPTLYGVVGTDAQGMVKSFVEKPGWDKVTSHMINAGIYILEPEVLAQVPASTPSMFENDLFPRLLEMGKSILGYPSDAYWLDLGTPEKYLKSNHDRLLARGRQTSQAIQIEGESQIDPTAQIEGPVLIGENCIIRARARVKGPAVLGPGCELAEGAVVEGSVIWHHSKVDKGAVLKNCVVCSHSHVEPDSQVLDNCVVGDNVIVGTGNRLANGVRVWPGKHLKPGNT